MIALLILGGFVGLLLGGELLVRGASGIAVRLGLSRLVVGVVIVGFGTSTPELVTCIRAALGGAPGIAVGNIVGSNIANILLILGAAALMRPMMVDRRVVLRDGGLVVVTALLFAAAAFTGMIGREAGMAFVAVLVAYIVFILRADRSRAATADETPAESGAPIGLSSVYLVLGLVLVVGGAEALVTGAVDLARILDVPDEVIGLTMVAVGTSLPELATSIVAAVRKHSEIALGNVLGSNIYNTVGIGGITALVAPIPVSEQMRAFDVPVMVAVSIVLVVVVATGGRVTRFEGLALLTLYAGYIAFVSGLA
jgi:cation:H+ antiporter